MHIFVKGNPDLCMGCRTCMAACVVNHEGGEIFHIDPDAYAFNPRLHMVKTAKISIPVQCKHCENPACKAACPVGCFTIVDNTVQLDTTNCIGCKNCAIACPFGAIDFTEETCLQAKGEVKVVANKCDLCYGIEGGPACVRVCPTEALQLVTEDEFKTAVKKNRTNTAKELDKLSKQKEEDQKFKCTVCGYIHEGELPMNFVCPVCQQDASKFVEM